MTLKARIVRQFGNPSGLIGGLAGHIMARRSSNQIRNQRTVELMALKPGMQVLEIGCGPGLALARCAAELGDGHVVALDHSPVMIAQADARIQRAGLDERVDFVTGGTEQLENWSNRFDRIFSLNVVMFISDKSEFYRAIHDALAPGGRCFTTYQPRMDTDHPDGAGQMADLVMAEMRRIGFESISCTPIKAGKANAVCVSGQRS